jgi:hypothetical protein
MCEWVCGFMAAAFRNAIDRAADRKKEYIDSRPSIYQHFR